MTERMHSIHPSIHHASIVMSEPSNQQIYASDHPTHIRAKDEMGMISIRHCCNKYCIISFHVLGGDEDSEEEQSEAHVIRKHRFTSSSPSLIYHTMHKCLDLRQ